MRQSPGDLSIQINEPTPTAVESAVAAAQAAVVDWSRMPLDRRLELLFAARSKLDSIKGELARGIALEVGKPIRECNGELAAVIAKFDFTAADAKKFLSDEPAEGALHPSLVRRRARGVAAVIGPFNFPIHLPHGQIVAHLAAGNPVIFKPSPFAANVCAKYAKAMSESLPPGVFSIVQGGAEEGRQLVAHDAIRSIAFTGSVAAGKAIARAIADDFRKDAALELGGKCAAIVCADADVNRAAEMCAEAACLTAGQRCNATSRVIVDRSVLSQFLEKFLPALQQFRPGDPLNEATKLGPLVSEVSLRRYEQLTREENIGGHWLLRGHVPASVEGKVGYYVEPAAALFEGIEAAKRGSRYTCEEAFAPIVSIIAVDERDLIAAHNMTPFGLTASIFTKSREGFDHIAEQLEVGNVYANLPTTFSPSQLPFGGWAESGNGRPGGKGFIRFASREQAVQWSADGFAS